MLKVTTNGEQMACEAEQALQHDEVATLPRETKSRLTGARIRHRMATVGRHSKLNQPVVR